MCQADGEVIITNDGATILNKMGVTQPAAKMLVELSKSQVCGRPQRAVHSRGAATPTAAIAPLRLMRRQPSWICGPARTQRLALCSQIPELLRREASRWALAGHAQDIVAGDGTTSVVVLCGALLKKALELLERGVHPTIISDSFNTAVNKAVEARAHGRRAGPCRIVPCS